MNTRRITDNLSSFAPFVIGLDALTTGFAQINSVVTNQSYPPHDLLKHSDDLYVLNIAVAGFKRYDLKVHCEGRALEVSGTMSESVEPDENGNKTYEYVHQGIAKRDWVKKFNLAEYIEVKNVVLEDGILRIELVRNIPDNAKFKTFEIK